MELLSVTTAAADPDVRVSVTVSPDVLEQATRGACEDLAARWNLPDAERASVLARIEDEVGPGEGERLLALNAVGSLVPYAIDQLDFFTCLEPVPVDVPQPEPGEDYTFSFDVRPVPQFELSSYEGVSVKMGRCGVSALEVEGQIDELLRGAEELVDASDTPVDDGDVVLIRSYVTEAGAPVVDFTKERGRLTVGRGDVPRSFEEQLIGHRKGDNYEFDFVVSAIDGVGHQRQLHAEVAILEDSVQRVPRLTDEWVARVIPQAGDAAGFRNLVREELLAEKRAIYEREKAHLAAVQLAERLQGSIPDEYVEYEQQSLMQQHEDEQAAQGLSMGEGNGTRESQAFTFNLAMQARENVRCNMALDALYRHLGMQVDEADLVAAVEDMHPGLVREALEYYESAGRMYKVRQAAQRLKASRHLASITTVDEIDI